MISGVLDEFSEKIQPGFSGELGEENRIVAGKGSSLRYIEDEERFSIDSHSSKNKGDGFAQFQELATLSHKSGKPI